MSTASNLHFPEDHEPARPSPPPQPPRHKRRWLRILGWTAAGLVSFVIVAIVAISALINVDGIHKAIVNFAQKEASKSLGVGVHIQDLVVRWSPLGVDLYGVTADSAGPKTLPPLLQVQHVNVSVAIVSLIHLKWYLSNLRIDRPVAWIYVNQNGVSNLPVFKSSGSSGNGASELFNLGIRHAVLDRGEVYYNSRPKSIAADVHNLDLRAVYNAADKKYSGRLAYSNGLLKYGAHEPIAHNLAIAFSLTPNQFQVEQAKLSSGNSQVTLAATVSNYAAAPSAQAQYQIVIDGAQMAHLLQSDSIPAGTIRAAGSLQYQANANRPLLQSVSLHGDLASNQLNVHSAAMSAQISNLGAHYSLADGNATLQDFHAHLLGGDVTAQGTMTDLGGNSHSKFSAALHGISLAQLKQVAGKSASAAPVTLAGTLNATAAAAWGKTLDSLVAHMDAGIHAQVSGRSQPAAPANGAILASTSGQAAATVPVESEIHVTYSRGNGRLQLVNSYLRTTDTDLTLSGTVSSNSSLAVRLQANNLSELASIANAFHPPAAGQPPLELAGTASFQGNVRGSMAAPHIAGQLVATNLHVNGSDWKLVRANVDASPDQASLQNAELEPAARGSIALSARAGLKKWAFSKQSPIRAQVHASQIDLADLMKMAGKQMPVSGTLNTNIDVRGSVMNPQGNGSIALTKIVAYQQPIQSVKVSFSGNGEQAQANLEVQLPAGGVQANVTVQPRQRTYKAQVTSQGIHLNQLVALKDRNIQANGVLALRASGQGSFDNPQLNAEIQMPTLTVDNQTLTGLNLQMNMADHVANASLTSTTLNTPIQAKATVHMTGNYLTDASLNTGTVSLRPLLALYSPQDADNVSGQTQVEATLHGPIKDFKQMEAHVTIPVLKMAYGNTIQLAAPAPIQVNYKDGVIDVPRGSIRGTDTELTFQGHIPTAGTAPMSLQVQGAINLQLAQLFNPDVRSSGQIKIDIDSHGALAKGADIGGQIEVVNANFAEASLPVGLQNGNGVLKLTTDRLNISSFEGTVGGGKVQVSGGVEYRPHMQFDLDMSAQGIRMLYPQGMRESIDANIRLVGSTTNAMLGGSVNLTNLSFTPAFQLTSFAGQLSGGVAGPPAQGITQNIHLNLAVHSSNNINLVSREVSVDGSANLQVRGTAAQPVILGRVNLTGGDIILEGNRYILSGGTVQFVNPMQTEPVLNLTITTTIQEYDIHLRFQGPVDQMHTEYTSDPALPTADIIHLLAFGSTTEAAANNPTPANQEAESLVASQVSSAVTSRISRVAGISQLSVSPVLQGGTAAGPPGAEITIRQRVTSKLFVTFSTNVATTQDEVIQGQYQVSPRVAISATRDQNGGFAIDALIKKSW